MSVSNFLSNIVSYFRDLPASEQESPVHIDFQAEPLCASTGLGDAFVPAVQGQAQQPSPLWNPFRLFRNEAIPLSNLSVNTSSLSFGDVDVGSSASPKSFSITNNSDCSVNYSVSGSPYGFNISSTSGSISPRSSVTLYVGFSPNYEQSYSGYYNIGSSGSVYVSGNGKKKK